MQTQRKSPVRMVLNGALGKMGTAVKICAAQNKEIEIVHEMDIGMPVLSDEAFVKADLIMDFSSHKATMALANFCRIHQKPLVIGTTAITPEGEETLLRASQVVPIVKTTNFSVGVNTLFWLTRKAAEILGP